MLWNCEYKDHRSMTGVGGGHGVTTKSMVNAREEKAMGQFHTNCWKQRPWVNVRMEKQQIEKRKGEHQDVPSIPHWGQSTGRL